MTRADAVTEYRLTAHARFEMERRQVSELAVARVLATPEQVEIVREDRKVYQSRVQLGDPPKTCLLRVFVDVDREPPEVVTAYYTSKVKKYWRVEA